MNRFSFLIAMAFLTACGNSGSGNKKNETDKRLVGEWNNLSLRIETQTKNNSDSNEVFEADRSQWEEKLKIRLIRTFFREDSTWNSAHTNLKDSLFYNPSGKWWTNGDQLTMLQLQPSPDTTIYTFHIKNDMATFECMLDWDMDGKKDDKYFGKQIKVSNK